MGVVGADMIDLAPVCPNCHAVIHSRSTPYSISEVREMLSTAKTGDTMRTTKPAEKVATSGVVEKRISIAKFIATIRTLKADKPESRPGIWYKTQKEHWLGWLSQYHGPGAYGRIPGMNRDAKFAYNHIMCPPMLLWLAKAAGVDRKKIAAARKSSEGAKTLPAEVGAIRKHLPWSDIYAALWGSGVRSHSPKR